MSGSDDGFISLPPGFDSGTLKLPPKTERSTSSNDIVFVPGGVGAPTAAPITDVETVTEVPSVTASRDQSMTQSESPASAPWLLRQPNGREIEVSSLVIVGRNPSALAGFEGALLVAVDDTTQSVSKSHAALDVDAQGLWVHDLNSTNGVWVVMGDDVTEAIPGRRIQVPSGARLELGDFVLEVRH